MSKRTISLSLTASLIFILLCIIFAQAGCGRLDMNVHTTVEPSGNIIQQFSFKGSGLMGGFLTEPDAFKDAREAGWQISTKQAGDSTTIILTKSSQDIRDLWVPGTTDMGAISKPDISDFRISDQIIFKEYFLDIAIPPASMPTSNGGDEEFQEFSKSLLNSMFSMSWTLTLPGSIVETNADTTEGGSATWYFSWDSLEKGRRITMHTRYINWPIVAIIVGAVGLIVFIAAIVARPRSHAARRTREEASQYAQGPPQISRCPTCGSSYAIGQRFCATCGAPLFPGSQQQPWGQQQTFRCPRCQAYTPHGANPCPNCGIWLNWR